MRKTSMLESVTMVITGHSIREMFDRYNTIINMDDTLEAVNQMEVFFQNVK